jgi:magnesium chelatase subunit D
MTPAPVAERQDPRDAASAAWADAALAAALLWVDPHGLGGVVVRAAAGAVRDRWFAHLEALRPEAAPLLRMPAHIGDDRLLGGLDLTATLRAGRPVAQRGLLAQCDGGVLVVAMAERLDAAPASRLCMAIDRGEVSVAREGIEARLPCRIGFVAFDEGEADDEHAPRALADRAAFHVDLRAIGWRDAGPPPLAAADVAQARAVLAHVVVPDELLEALVAAAVALGVDAPRAALHALRATRAVAALQGRAEAGADDAAAAVRLVLAPRATRLPAAESEAEAQPDEPPEPPPDDAAAPDPADEAADAGALEDRLVEAALAAMPADLLAQLRAGGPRRDRGQRSGRAGTTSASKLRGRPIGARRGEPRAGARLALVDTLRAAAPWQRVRRAAHPTGPRIAVRGEDFHVTRFRQRQATTTIFVIDASGSAALHRLAEAKGAVELLLADCYVRRDEVAVVGFRGRAAELLLPPTRSLVRAKRSLAGLPGGGGTPLAAGIDAAAALADQVRRGGATPVVVMLTDGRANIGRDGSPGRERAADDALRAARSLRAAGVPVLLVDTAAQPEPAARRLADALGATYLALPYARADSLARVARALPGSHA